MIKKLFHIIFAIIFSAMFSALVLAAFYYAYRHFYRINILLPQTYRNIAAYWNTGATLSGNDLLMLFGIFSLVPLNLLGWWFIYRCKFANLVFKPLAWLSNLGAKDYKAPDINIKNLKIEEKKTIEQLVSERLEQEKKKRPTANINNFRQDIIEQIEQKRK
ncbi:MAG: hypothetical protein IJ099_01270 [Alphaproteobacteria bacterium]|nr:hypothetical protein [Alphaproteobacteria bacterium]